MSETKLQILTEHRILRRCLTLTTQVFERKQSHQQRSGKFVIRHAASNCEESRRAKELNPNTIQRKMKDYHFGTDSSAYLKSKNERKRMIENEFDSSECIGVHAYLVRKQKQQVESWKTQRYIANLGKLRNNGQEYYENTRTKRVLSNGSTRVV